jgi:hypothetical protein
MSGDGGASPIYRLVTCSPDSVDRVWQPMESLYPPDKPPIPPWNAGVNTDKATDQVNELALPAGCRP